MLPKIYSKTKIIGFFSDLPSVNVWRKNCFPNWSLGILDKALSEKRNQAQRVIIQTHKRSYFDWTCALWLMISLIFSFHHKFYPVKVFHKLRIFNSGTHSYFYHIKIFMIWISGSHHSWSHHLTCLVQKQIHAFIIVYYNMNRFMIANLSIHWYIHKVDSNKTLIKKGSHWAPVDVPRESAAGSVWTELGSKTDYAV